MRLDEDKNKESGTATYLVLPGHGVPFKEKSRITAFQGYLADFVAQGKRLRAEGKTPEETARQADLTKYRETFPQIQGPGADIRGVRRLYEWLDEKAKK